MSFYDAIRVGASGVSGDLEIQRSLRFNRDDSAYLTRSQSSPTNAKKATVSTWLKRTDIGTGNTFFEVGYQGTHDRCSLTLFDTTDGNKLGVFQRDSSGIVCNLSTTQVFRDPSAWFHVVVAFDTTQSTAADRVKIYINGSQVTSFDSSVYYSQNHDLTVGSGYNTNIGYYGAGSNYYGGYMAEVNFIDGQQLTPSSFGETNTETGQWNPKKFSGGSYGTNGFRLTFEDNSNNAALGTDTSGNGNTFTVNNISSSHDTLIDTPSNNFCVFNELNRTNDANLTDGNLIFVQSSNDESVTGTFGIDSGKWYWEVYKKSTENPELGIDTNQRVLSNKTDDVSPTKVCFRTNGGDQQVGTGTPTSITGSSGGQTGAGVIRIAVDFDNKKIWYSDLSGNFFNSGNPATGSNAAFDFSSVAVANGCVPYFFCGTGANDSIFVNFGADSSFGGNLTGSEVQSNTDGNGNGLFKYAVPSGYLALCSANLPDPTILLPNKHFGTLTYTGDGSASRTISDTSSVNFTPDWVWAKNRSQTDWHILSDAVRGFDGKTLYTNRTDAEYDASGSGEHGYISAAANGGFVATDSDGSVGGNLNANSENYVAWNWNAGDTDGKTYTVKVVSDSGNKYRFDDFGTSAVTLDLAEGGTYTFDQSDSSMSSHPMQLSTTANGTHGGGSAYSTGVTYQLDGSTVTASAFISGFSSATSRKLIITVAASAPTLYYYCYYHSGMGGAVNTNSTLGSSNFDGTLQATVKANTTAGFSIITWTGNQTSGATLGHGLGVAPKAAFVKRRDGTSNWISPLFDLQTAGKLNSSDAFANSYYNVFFTSQPSSTLITIGSNDDINRNTSTYVAYVFSEVSSYNKFASYTGNGSTDGTFVFTGFRPAWVLISNSNAGFDWVLQDSKRSPGNVANKKLNPNQSAAEQSNYDKIDILSNGFKPRVSDAGVNANGSVYYYWAFAESPFKNSRAR